MRKAPVQEAILEALELYFPETLSARELAQLTLNAENSVTGALTALYRDKKAVRFSSRSDECGKTIHHFYSREGDSCLVNRGGLKEHYRYRLHLSWFEVYGRAAIQILSERLSEKV